MPSMPLPEIGSQDFDCRHKYEGLDGFTFVCSGQCQPCVPPGGQTRQEHNDKLRKLVTTTLGFYPPPVSVLDNYISRHGYKPGSKTIDKIVATSLRTDPKFTKLRGERLPFVLTMPLKDMILTDLHFYADLMQIGIYTKSGAHPQESESSSFQALTVDVDLSVILESVLLETLDTVRRSQYNRVSQREEWLDKCIPLVLSGDNTHQSIQVGHASFPRLLMEGQRITIRGTAPVGATIGLRLDGFAKPPPVEEAALSAELSEMSEPSDCSEPEEPVTEGSTVSGDDPNNVNRIWTGHGSCIEFSNTEFSTPTPDRVDVGDSE